MNHQKILQVIKKADGVWGVVVKRIGGDVLFEHNPNQEFPSASVAKVPIALYVLHLVEGGEVRLNDYFKISKKYYLDGSGVIKYLQPNLKLTLKDIISLMLITSDNTAAKFLVHTFRIEKINSYLRSIGLTKTQLKTDGKKFGYGMTTPREMARIFEGIFTNKFLNQKNSKLLLDILKNVQGDSEIRRYLPHDRYDDQKKLEVADKGGAIPGVRNDVGIVFAKQPYVISVFSKDLIDKSYKVDNAGVLTIAQISKIAYEELE